MALKKQKSLLKLINDKHQRVEQIIRAKEYMNP